MIPVYSPYLKGNERKYVDECVDTTWISSKGRFVTEFEDAFSSYIGVEYGTAVFNGTVAIHLAMVALGIGAGDEVIVPTFTYIASANPITQVGGVPIFVDSDPESWQMDPADVRRKITPKTKAIMAVHLYGHPCDMKAICAIAKEHGLFVVEDCAEAIGSMQDGRKVGSFGDIACFSFFGNKTITCGEGGMVLTRDATLHERLVHLKGQGLAKYREYWHDVVGFNYRMTNIQAAIGLAQLEQIDLIIDKKRTIAANYKTSLSDLPLVFHDAKDSSYFHTYWMCSILAESAKLRDPLREHLKAAGIETRPTFYPIHTMPMYSQKYERHKVAEDISLRGINLPSFPGLDPEEQATITEKIHEFYE